ncbi:hypothetical protein ES703_77733 [subsurface metagenome]
MRLTVITNNATSVNSKNNRQILEANIMYNLVESTLQEGRIYSHNRYETLGSQAGGKGNRVLLTDANIKYTLWKLSGNNTQITSLGHGWGNRYQLGILPSQAKHSSSKYLTVSWCCLGVCTFGWHTMEVNSISLGWMITFALGSNNMN